MLFKRFRRKKKLFTKAKPYSLLSIQVKKSHSCSRIGREKRGKKMFRWHLLSLLFGSYAFLNFGSWVSHGMVLQREDTISLKKVISKCKVPRIT